MIQRNLTSPETFQDWFSNAQPNHTNQELLDSLAGQDDMSRCRRMCIAYWTLHPTPEVRLSMIKDCLRAHDERVQKYAMAFLVYWRVIDELSIQENSQQLETAAYLPMLKANLRFLRQDGSEFAFEVSAMTLVSMALISLMQEQYESALEQASEALFFATEVKAGVVKAQINSLLLSIHLAKADLKDVLSIAVQNQSKFVPAVDLAYQSLFSAIALSQLGNFDLSMKQIKQLVEQHPINPEPEDADLSLSIHAAKQQVQLFGFRGGLNGEVIQDHYPITWFVKAFREVIKAQSLQRLNQKQLSSMLKHYQNAEKFCIEGQASIPDSRIDLHSSWLRAYAALKQNETAKALGILNSMPRILEGWLDLRLLVAGLKLELALNLNHPTLNPYDFEQDIRQIFKEASYIELASRNGLADLLSKWHPLAAAYLALNPEPIAEFCKASEAILHTGYSNAVYDISLPPSFACELALRSLDIDIRHKNDFLASDPGSSRKKRLQLLSQRDELEYWRPSYSVALLIYGLKKVGLDAYDTQAALLYRNYGVTPYVCGSYALAPMLKCVDEYTQALITDEFTVEQFSQNLLKL